MRKYSVILIQFLFLLVLSLPAIPSKAQEKEIEVVRMGFNPFRDPEALRKGAARLAEIIGEKAGLHVEAYVASDYSDLIEKMRASFKVTGQTLQSLKSDELADEIVKKLESMEDQVFKGKENFLSAIKTTIGEEQTDKYESSILKHVNVDRGELDFAWLAPLSYVRAEATADARVLVKAVRNGVPYYWSAIIVRKDNNSIKSLDDLRGKRFGWAEPGSTSGFLIPMGLFLEKGINPQTYFKQSGFAGGHDKLVEWVLKGTVDAGATFANDTENQRNAWTQFLDEKDANKIHAIEYSKPIPNDALATTTVFFESYPEVTQKLVDAIIDLKDLEEGKKLLKQIYNIDYMILADSKDYEPIRDARRALTGGSQ